MKDIVLNLGVNDVKKSGSKASLGDIVFWMEYGTETAPPRPANRMAMDTAIRQHKKHIQAYLKNMANAIHIKDHRQMKREMQRRKKVLFTQIGKTAVKEVKNIIKSGSTVGNAPATIKKKGFDHPLYVDGTYMKNSAYEVKEV